MPLNIPGLLVPFQLFINPRIILPGLVVKGIVPLLYTICSLRIIYSKIFDTLILQHFVRPDTEALSSTKITALFVHRLKHAIIFSNGTCNRHFPTKTRLYLKYRLVGNFIKGSEADLSACAGRMESLQKNFR